MGQFAPELHGAQGPDSKRVRPLKTCNLFILHYAKNAKLDRTAEQGYGAVTQFLPRSSSNNTGSSAPLVTWNGLYREFFVRARGR